MKPRTIGVLLIGGLLMVLAVGSAEEYFTHKENWPSSMSGWTDRDAGKMTVSWANYPAAGGTLLGNFAAQAIGVPESDAFRAVPSSSGGKFTGNYRTNGLIPQSLGFSFIAQDVLPSALQCRLRGNGVTFFYAITGQVQAAGTWYAVTVPLSFSDGWVGGTEEQFSNALGAVEWVDVQITRNGTAAQNYYLANFSRVSLVPDDVATNDADADGMPDYWEDLYELTGSSPDGDEDGDGVSNRDEYGLGTNPRDASSLLECLTIVRSPSNTLVVMFDSVKGRSYRLQGAPATQPTDWADVSAPVEGVDGFTTAGDTNAAGVSGWYRVRAYRP